MIIIKNVNKNFKNRELFNNMNLEFKSDTGLILISGRSGSGKSTILNLLGGTEFPDSGEIFINIGNKKLTIDKKGKSGDVKVDYIFQNFNLIENLSALNNLKLSLGVLGINISGDQIMEKAKILNIAENQLKSKVKDLSGGERQRIAILRILLRDPDIILADEPTGNLDNQNSEIIYNLLKDLSKDKMVILVSHDYNQAIKYADSVINIEDGVVISTEHKNNLFESVDNSEVLLGNKKNLESNLMTKLRQFKMLAIKDLVGKKWHAFFLIIITTLCLLSLSLILSINLNANIFVNNSSISNFQRDVVTAQISNNNIKNDIDNNYSQFGLEEKIELYSLPNDLSISSLGAVRRIDANAYTPIEYNQFFTNKFGEKFVGIWPNPDDNSIVISERLFKDLSMNLENRNSVQLSLFGSSQSIQLNVVGYTSFTNWQGIEQNFISSRLLNELAKNNIEQNYPTLLASREKPRVILDDSKQIYDIKAVFEIVPPNLEATLVNEFDVIISSDLANGQNLINTNWQTDGSSFQKKWDFKIVDLDNNSTGKIYFKSSAIEKMKTLDLEYIQYYFNSVENADRARNFANTNYSGTNNFSLIENNQGTFQNFALLSSIINIVLVLLILVISIISIVMTIFYSRILLESKQKEIGILKVLGSSKNLTYFYHISTFMFILIGSIVLSLILYYPSLLIVQAFMPEFAISNINQGLSITYLFASWVILGLLLLVIYYLISIKTFSKKTVELLKDNT
ncbi:ABC-type lipoprotein export system ATPase subunit [Mycoplasma testudineum]|uniref:ABC-type lipoprotein export system ATPase subunit n=1 Tax=Mycoplasma testudineum TaxID=244584 RepID=A0A4R6ID99_9MOLU|nr:ABC transporter ATP-binding protein [Mycoplasma testudineum]OYD26758.1 hypothetical protein CG473_02270 [Mycoplasma testudineum]TDO19894.1 ABC-type lipoprotein export system ATPase subunit [Mycoplasma testudineum]